MACGVVVAAVLSVTPDALLSPSLLLVLCSTVCLLAVITYSVCCLQVELYYLTAANQLQRPFVRCIVVGDSNRSMEAAHELGMKSVIVTGTQPAWNFSNADLVVRNLSALSFVNMKKLFGNEDLIEPQYEHEEEPSYL